jgi:hypothetical protein
MIIVSSIFRRFSKTLKSQPFGFLSCSCKAAWPITIQIGSQVDHHKVCLFVTEETMLKRIYNSHYGNGVPAMFTS